MSKHTPGPWEVRDMAYYKGRNWREVFAADRTPIIVSDSFTRTSMGETEEHSGVRISEANARLIAAAPCLLEALRKIAGWGCGCNPICRCRTEDALRVWQDEVQDLARAAIARATGDES